MADFRRDVTAGKWTSYLRFAAGVIFAAPAGLLKKDDIPAGCGLIVRGPDGWRTMKGPTLKNMENLPRDAWVKLIIDGLPREIERAKCQGRAAIVSEWKLTHLLRAKLGDLVAEAVRDRLSAEHRLHDATEALKTAAKEAEDERQLILSRSRERAQRDATLIDEARAALAQSLGLRADAGAMQISMACHEAARRLNADTEIQRLRHLIERMQMALDTGREPLPHIAQEGA